MMYIPNLHTQSHTHARTHTCTHARTHAHTHTHTHTPPLPHLDSVRCHKGLQGVHGYHPGGDGSAEVLPQERPKGDVLPLLDVSGCRIGDCHRTAHYNRTHREQGTLHLPLVFAPDLQHFKSTLGQECTICR